MSGFYNQPYKRKSSSSKNMIITIIFFVLAVLGVRSYLSTVLDQEQKVSNNPTFPTEVAIPDNLNETSITEPVDNPDQEAITHTVDEIENQLTIASEASFTAQTNRSYNRKNNKGRNSSKPNTKQAKKEDKPDREKVTLPVIPENLKGQKKFSAFETTESIERNLFNEKQQKALTASKIKEMIIKEEMKLAQNK